jgi:hypothetical protein
MYKDEAYDFDQFIGHMHPELAGGNPPWPVGVRDHLSPVWDEIKDKTLQSAYTHVETRLNETKGNVSLFGLTIFRQQMLVYGSGALLILVCAMMFSVRRLDAATVLGFPGPASFPDQLAPALTFLSTVALPIVTFGYIIVRFGEAHLSGETVASGLAAGAGAICAILSYRWILERRRPQLSEAGRQSVELVKAQVASYGRAAMRPSRVLGRVLLIWMMDASCFSRPLVFFGSPVIQATRAAENGSTRDSSEAARSGWCSIVDRHVFSCPGGTGPL